MLLPGSPKMPLIQASTFMRLPQELLEQTIISCAQGQFPKTIASLAQTGQFFTNLIYRTPDNHLWREIFLAMFDDPRPVLAAQYEATPEGPPFHSALLPSGTVPFEWQLEFQSRIHAATYIQRHTKDQYFAEATDSHVSASADMLSFDSVSDCLVFFVYDRLTTGLVLFLIRTTSTNNESPHLGRGNLGCLPPVYVPPSHLLSSLCDIWFSFCIKYI